METKTIINGHTVVHDESVNNGIRYLIHLLEPKESNVFFDQAFNHGFVFFEDQMGYNYKLIHHGAEFKLIKA